MDPAVGPAGGHGRRRAVRQAGQRRFELALYRPHARLDLPSLETRAVVMERQADPVQAGRGLRLVCALFGL
jgi:hypothetical protein